MVVSLGHSIKLDLPSAKKQGVRQPQSVYTLLFDTYKALIVTWLYGRDEVDTPVRIRIA